MKETPRTFAVDLVTKAAAERISVRSHCRCLAVRGKTGVPSVPKLHTGVQDRQVPGWAQVIELIETELQSDSLIFEPSASIAWDDWIGMITLPPAIARLAGVREVRLYGSHLQRLPPEIGRMASLEDLDIYTSYSLHWLPYEVTRCTSLARTRVSRRALYGNINTRLPFPRLDRPIEALVPDTCSVCDRPFGHAVPLPLWTTLRVGTDVVPLLVHSCSKDCTYSIPRSPPGYYPRPHRGGGGVGMPDIIE